MHLLLLPLLLLSFPELLFQLPKLLLILFIDLALILLPRPLERFSPFLLQGRQLSLEHGNLLVVLLLHGLEEVGGEGLVGSFNG